MLFRSEKLGEELNGEQYGTASDVFVIGFAGEVERKPAKSNTVYSAFLSQQHDKLLPRTKDTVTTGGSCCGHVMREAQRS